MTPPRPDEAAGSRDTAVNDETLDHLLRLARLSVPDDERAALKLDLSKVLAFVDQLRSVDVEGVGELTRPVTPSGAERPDRLEPSLPREQALALAPAVADGFFQVPRTVDEG